MELQISVFLRTLGLDVIDLLFYILGLHSRQVEIRICILKNYKVWLFYSILLIFELPFVAVEDHFAESIST